ncbi:MAG TPA: glycosyltransferase, partial [Candidatus Acidoferrum sp.]|nr:glycosyltransferase [Candidatus Acidoferrum sp.]
MPLTPTLIATIPLAIWLYLFFARGNFWQLQEDTAAPQPLAHWPRVVVIVPARNEAESIARSVTSLVKQGYHGEFSVVVIDDHSGDATATLALKAAEESGASGRISIHSAGELPPGWAGKVWAMNEGVRAAEGKEPDFFWFTDADIEHAPDTLRRLVVRAENDSLDLASLMVLLQAKSFPERLLIPPFLYFFLMLYPPRWIANSSARTAGAAGGCILLRRAALESIGGLS